MSKLIVQWVNVTRGRDEAAKIEAAYKARLLELCDNDVEKVRELRERHYKNHQRVDSGWSIYNCLAQSQATRDLLPSERNGAAFSVRFE